MTPTTHRVLDAVKASGVRYELAPGWDDPGNAAPGSWDPAYVLLHHTGNGGAKGDAPSLGWCVRGSYPPVRNCHFLVARSGIVHVVYALGAYHAGEGGPLRRPGGPLVAKDTMNHRAFGIEIESAGLSLDTTRKGGTDGITPAQYDATAKLAASLLELIGAPDTCAVNHRTWAPTRKVDTRDTDNNWQARIRAVSKGDEMTPNDVWSYDVDPGKDSSYSASGALFVTLGRTGQIMADVRAIRDALGSGVEPPEQGVGQTALSDADVDRIARRTADLLADRLKS